MAKTQDHVEFEPGMTLYWVHDGVIREHHTNPETHEVQDGAVWSKMNKVSPPTKMVLSGSFAKRRNAEWRLKNPHVPFPPVDSKTGETPEYVGPCEGGCWYCNWRDSNLDLFCREFDTYMHLACLKKAIAERPGDRETEIIAREFKELLQREQVAIPPRRGSVSWEHLSQPDEYDPDARRRRDWR